MSLSCIYFTRECTGCMNCHDDHFCDDEFEPYGTSYTSTGSEDTQSFLADLQARLRDKEG